MMRGVPRQTLDRSITSTTSAARSTRTPGVEVEWGPAGDYAAELRIPSRKFKELCVALKKGERVAWSFSSSAATSFNIHYHVGKEVSYPAKVEGIRSADGLLAVPADQHYCWMWKADADAVELTARLHRERQAGH